MNMNPEKTNFIKRLKANEAYLGRIDSIFFDKTCCYPVFFWNKEKIELKHKCIQIADSQGNSVSISRKDNVTKARLDGTDFVIYTNTDDEKGQFVYSCNNIGVHYTFSERDIGDDVIERVLRRRIDNNETTIKYYVKDKVLLIEHFYQRDISKDNPKASEDENLVALAYEELAHMSDEEKIQLINDMLMEAYEMSETSDMSNYEEDKTNEIDSETSENIVDYSKRSFVGEVYYVKNFDELEIRVYEVPEKVCDFDYEDYNNFLNGVVEEVPELPEIIASQELDDDEYGGIDEEKYRIFYQQEIEDSELKEEIIDKVYEVVSEYNDEIIDLVDEIDDINNEYDRAVKMIREYYVRMKNYPDLPTDMDEER